MRKFAVINQIYTAGYAGHIPQQLLEAADKLGASVIDIRYKPRSRIAGWNAKEINQVLHESRYSLLSALGNVGRFEGGGMRLENEKFGLDCVCEMAKAKPVILLCSCSDYASCHRAYVSQLLAQRGIQTQELEWPEQTGTGLIKCISLWQPWASLIAIGAKKIETRGWATSYRGTLAIHAAKRKPDMDLLEDEAFVYTLADAGLINFNFGEWELHEHFLPLGALVAVADLVDCISTDVLCPKISLQEKSFGDYSPRRFGWVLDNIRHLKTPIPLRGQQGLFDIGAGLVSL
jgi:hypothetical protein